MRNQESLFVTVIAGPTGVGKTTLSKMLSRNYHCVYLSEDEIAQEIFPDEYKNLEEFPDKVETIAGELFKRAQEGFRSGKCIVMDRINLEREFIEEIEKAFHNRLILKVLWPSVETTIERDQRREGWTSGANTIKQYYKKYEELKPVIGEENFINTSHQTPEETLERVIACIKRA